MNRALRTFPSLLFIVGVVIMSQILLLLFSDLLNITKQLLMLVLVIGVIGWKWAEDYYQAKGAKS